MKITITHHTVCRTPVFALSSTIELSWPKLKLLIAESSPDFYQQIAHINESDLTNLPVKIRFTIWKYFNRCRYRPTPFGEFASVTIIDNLKDDQSDIVVSGIVECRRLFDWSGTESVINLPNYDLNTLICCNPTIYKQQEEYRYLYRDAAGFELTSIPAWEEIDQVMAFCKRKISFGNVAQLLKDKLGFTVKESRGLISQLIELQALHSELQPNITGGDYFDRLQLIPTIQVPDYCISSRCHIQGKLSDIYLKTSQDYIEFMARLLPAVRNTDLDKFKLDFSRRWEQQAVPLSLVLDGLLGIGYGSSSYGTEFPLTGALNKAKKEVNSSVEIGDLQSFLLNKMMQGNEVNLDSYKISSSSIPVQNPKLPNTFSMQLEVYDGKAVIYSAGGATANALLGRFTRIDQYLVYARELAELEQKANPDVLFFDVAYAFEGAVDNVNRRAHIYPAELCFSAWSTHEKSLQMEDILVCIVKNEVMLQHRTSGKRLVPRIASAYNYNRSDLVHFRFLNDLQYQGLTSQLNFDLQDYFPRLDSYPRVTYRNCIVNPAKWLLPNFESLLELNNWFLDKKIDQLIKVGYGDQTLVIDPKCETDIIFLHRYQKQQDRPIYVSEALIERSGTVSDNRGKKYHAQFIVDFQHQGLLYSGIPSVEQPIFKRDLKMTGSEWLYLELYIHPMAMKDFLNNEVRRLIKSQKRLITRWFFIHYNDPQDHLRLRLKLKDPAQLPVILQCINKLVCISNEYGHLKKLLIRGYEREIFRYGIEQMDMVEQFFFLDSTLALTHITKPVEYRYELIIDFVQKLSERLFINIDELVKFYERMARLFAEEMKFEKEEFKAINVAYGVFSKKIFSRKNSFKSILCLFDKMLYICPQKKREKLLADLIHLHINRRFSQEQRLHEAVLYQYLYKLCLKRMMVKNISL